MYYTDYTDEPQHTAADEAAFLASEAAESDSYYTAAADDQIAREAETARQRAIADHRCSRCGRRLPAYMFTTIAGSGICNDCI
jgi:hypothetical protein